MRLLWPWAVLPALVTLLLLVTGYRRLTARAARRRSDLARLGLVVTGSATGSASTGRSGGRTRRLASGLLLVALVLLLFGLVRPEITVAQAHREGTLVLAVDASASMAATDLEPTRIEAAKRAARSLLERQPESIRVAVVAFGDAGLVLQSPTTDHRAASAAIDRITVQGGTGLTAGIQTSLNAIAGHSVKIDSPAAVDGSDGGAGSGGAGPGESSPAPSLGYYPNSAIVLLSDGENTDQSDPMVAAEVASAAGVRIFPVGLGSPQGGVIEVDGLKVSTVLDEKTLTHIAQVTGGRYYSAADAEQLSEIYTTIDLGWVVRREPIELSGALAGLAALALATSAAVSLRRTGRVL